MPSIITNIEQEIEVEFEVWCEQCGKGLCNKTDVRGNQVDVEPCPDCLDDAKDEGQKEAKEDLEKDYSSGYEDGYDAGYQKAYEEMREQGLLEGLGESGELIVKPACIRDRDEK